MANQKTSDRFARFLEIVRRLRSECPWDREQTHESIRHSLIEETYEVVEAIDRRDFHHLRTELGDLLLHILMHAVMAEEAGRFTIDEILEGIAEKMIRRHPHVFGNVQVSGASEVKRNWERIKVAEGRSSALEGVPQELPALLRAHRLQEKASKVGFDWEHKDQVWEKVREELRELRDAERQGSPQKTEEELGDLLFSLVNYSRFLHLNPELALRAAIEKFTARFQRVEQRLRDAGKDLSQSSLEEMDRLWNEEKDS